MTSSGIEPATFRLDCVSNNEGGKLIKRRLVWTPRKFCTALHEPFRHCPVFYSPNWSWAHSNLDTTSPFSLCILLYFTGSEWHKGYRLTTESRQPSCMNQPVQFISSDRSQPPLSADFDESDILTGHNAQKHLIFFVHHYAPTSRFVVLNISYMRGTRL
jgi:hypothetical protein